MCETRTWVQRADKEGVLRASKIEPVVTFVLLPRLQSSAPPLAPAASDCAASARNVGSWPSRHSLPRLLFFGFLNLGSSSHLLGANPKHLPWCYLRRSPRRLERSPPKRGRQARALPALAPRAGLWYSTRRPRAVPHAGDKAAFQIASMSWQMLGSNATVPSPVA